MALTLPEASKLSNDVLLIGVIETIIKDSPILEKLPFIEIVGNGLTYNKELTLGTVDFYKVGDPWAESTPDFEQLTAVLRILGADADVDNFIKATRSNLQDVEVAVIQMKAKAAQHKFDETFIYGDNAVSATEFDGLVRLIDTATASNQLVAIAAAGGALTLAKMDELCDAVQGGSPDLLLMSRRSRRKLTNIARTAGSNLEVGKGLLGDFVQFYNGIPVGVSDFVLDTHTTIAGSVEANPLTFTGTQSSIYALQFGDGALCGLSSPGGLQVERIGSLETKDATRTRIKWYCSLALFSEVKAAALIGITA